MKKISLYNTLNRKKEEFKPLRPNELSVYYCGPTVYWTQHIGNLRGAFCTDVITRTFEYLGYKVNLVRNYTDVGHLSSDADEGEDRMEKGAKRENLQPEQIAQKYIDIFENDSKELNIKQPSHKPKATEHINDMIELVSELIEKGFAYVTDLAVYFDVSLVTEYNKLSKQVVEKNISGAGSGAVRDDMKKNPEDFALWFFKAGTHKNAIQFWPSPFKSTLVENGEGFPGWHIECSAMSRHFLGKTIDIHMGGIEHIPVHHTNEIAQSEAANGCVFANYWLHNEHLLVNNGKMSKSEGTSYSLSEIKEKGYKPLALRYFFLQANYRSKQNFTWDALSASTKGYDRLR
ncbi:cysteine--tRNA ligase, partial [Candidatus Parcubacteria bacterium]